MLNAIIFDMDGVLVETQKIGLESINLLLSEQGVQISEEESKITLGWTIKDKLDRWKEKYGFKIDDYNLFIKKNAEKQFELVKAGHRENTFLEKIINDAKKNNIKLAVATSSTRFRAMEILEIIGMRDKMDVIITGEDVKTHKPEPEIYIKTAKHLGVRPEGCLVIEDSRFGVEAGKKAGMKVVGVLTGYNNPEALKESNLLIKDFSELNLDILVKLFE